MSATERATGAVADNIHALACMAQVGLGEPHSDETCGLRYEGDGDHLIAASVLDFLRHAIHAPGPGPDAIRETLGLPSPEALPCEACNAEAGEPCRWPCTAHAEALELMERGEV